MKYSIVFLFCFHWNSFSALDTTWWKHTIIYELIPYTFKDSDGDGIGDLKGITSKLDHFSDLGIETIELTPIWETAFFDFGYDVVDYYKINPQLGTMEDFEELTRKMRKRGMKLMLDMVINHSSDKNEWFLKSIDRIDPYTDYYVWKDAKGYDENTGRYIPPNGWRCFFLPYDYGSAWEWNEKRKQFYYHEFLSQQPDLNLRNEVLKEELKKMLTFWMNKGVAGFRLDAAPMFFEDKDLRDDIYDGQMALPEMYEFIHELRLLLDEYSAKHGDFERILVPEVHDAPEFQRSFYDRENYKLTQFPFYYALQQESTDMDAIYFNQFIEPWLNQLPEGASTAWVTGDHDVSRVGSRIRPEYSDIFTITTMLLPGTTVCYYGQEIAMLNGYTQPGQLKDVSGHGNRDPSRLIMQWDDSINAGFSTNTISTFLPSSSDYVFRNVEAQKGEEFSHYQLFKDLATIKRMDALKYGTTKIYIPSKFIYIFTRSHENRIFVIVVNFSTLNEKVDLKAAITDLPTEMSVATASVNSIQQKGFKYEWKVSNKLIMRPLSSVVLEGYRGNDK